MKKERKLYTSFEQLPLTLNADDIAAYLNISRGNAYTLSGGLSNAPDRKTDDRPARQIPCLA